MSGSIRFFSEKVPYRCPDRIARRAWLLRAAKDQGRVAGDINYIFCSDEDLLSMNKKFLRHNTYTDIITFDYSLGKTVAGDIYISIDRARENAKKFSVKTESEVNRLLIHGLLHLCGYKDKNPADKLKMTSLEDKYLSRFRK